MGSGLAGLAFGALMARAGKKVHVLEAHEFPGGYGHTFAEKKHYRFNAQLHYVWSCGEGQSVNEFLRKLGLERKVTFERYDPDGFDHMRMPGYALDIPNDYDELIRRLQDLFPGDGAAIERFLRQVQRVSAEMDALPSPMRLLTLLQKAPKLTQLMRHRTHTLQDVFDRYRVPAEAQTLLALQWPDFLLPPGQLSFFAWVSLFDGYMRGAYYPTRHFEHVINSLVGVIEDSGGQVLLNRKVVRFLVQGDKVTGVIAEHATRPDEKSEHLAGTVICNADPRRAAEMIGFDRFSPRVLRQLNYDYSPSNFMIYGAVTGIDLREHGFGKWNTFHTEQPDLNRAFREMYEHGDYARPSFAITTPSLITPDNSDCPEGDQLFEILTVANYQRFLDLKMRSPRAYKDEKKKIVEQLLDVIEAHYVPDFRSHIRFMISGSPTTNERYCGSPFGNSYGSNLTPQNMGPGRLGPGSSLKNFYFCNAYSGYPGFVGTIWTGRRLYEQLTGDTL